MVHLSAVILFTLTAQQCKALLGPEAGSEANPAPDPSRSMAWRGVSDSSLAEKMVSNGYTSSERQLPFLALLHRQLLLTPYYLVSPLQDCYGRCVAGSLRWPSRFLARHRAAAKRTRSAAKGPPSSKPSVALRE